MTKTTCEQVEYDTRGPGHWLCHGAFMTVLSSSGIFGGGVFRQLTLELMEWMDSYGWGSRGDSVKCLKSFINLQND